MKRSLKINSDFGLSNNKVGCNSIRGILHCCMDKVAYNILGYNILDCYYNNIQDYNNWDYCSVLETIDSRAAMPALKLQNVFQITPINKIIADNNNFLFDEENDLPNFWDTS